ncbi:MAG TPA: bifunctional biotin--[acetyl-CoA-carboxylase] ligase/biotin operon repressor BirA [Gammaproteobacteria bacterium]|nr:bifunctional biotin--[acetyl-CoA-carboxylase] ligase/biotin operon repressor BirA [Gammaproteobacteria bacterium]
MKIISTKLIQLITLLNDQAYHDGTTIGEKLNVTRSAVWKMIKKLHAYGVQIESVKGKGYRLITPLKLLDRRSIRQQLTDKIVKIEVFESIGSTNEYLKSYYTDKATRICLAEQQEQGKARLQRNWYSPFGLNVYFSCLYHFQQDMSELAGLSLVVSLAVVKTLHGYGLPASLAVKWPNDVVYLGQKLAGILIEVQAETHGVCHAIIGIGINVNIHQDANRQIDQPWTSLMNILDEYIDRNQLCATLANYLLQDLKRFEKLGLAAFMAEWQTVDLLTGQMVTLKCGEHLITGMAMGINAHGHLLLRLKNGKMQAFSSGDASVIKRRAKM